MLAAGRGAADSVRSQDLLPANVAAHLALYQEKKRGV
jgi:hypothetical protein